MGLGCASLLGGLVLGAFNRSLGYESLETEELGSFIGVFDRNYSSHTINH